MTQVLLDIARFSLSVTLLLLTGLHSYGQDDESLFASIKTVVIDAGHGGKDPGCHGAAANEKTVCLNMALKLGEMIKKEYPHIKVVYTRDKDVFVELDERARIANRNNADLFICIHANSASPSAYGAETYVLGLHRTEAQQKVAERENSIIHLEDDGGAKYKDFDMSPDAIIARQIQLSVFLDQSINFASKLQHEFKTLGRHDRGVKQAGFLVLYKTTMPSVLIETGFLTNPSEEKFLSSVRSQEEMAKAMFTAFKKYKNELEGVDEQVVSNYTVIEDNNEVTNNIDQSSEQDQVVFRVQIETSSAPIKLTDSRFKGIQVYEYKQDKLYKYTTGRFINDFNKANELKNKLRQEGFQHAFVVAFINNERVDLQKAIKLAEK